ncbi:MAG: DUF547 domain-containing protein [Minwuia sp.]|nr:DUF547 domain-containing protein [Minwuia sp.]
MPYLRPLLWVLVAVFSLSQVQAASWERLFAPKSDLWEVWTPHDPASTVQVDHSGWDAVLKTHAMPGPDGVMRFDYRGLAANRAGLDSYLETMGAVPVSALNRPAQFAYWVNLYNALTVRLIVDNPGVETIRDIDISPGLFASGPWDAELITVQGRPLTLNQIEHRILRPIFKDPRIHYAVNCASIGCPDLRAEAFVPDRLEAQLNAQAATFINHPRGARIDGDGNLHVSSIFVWFREDFGGTETGVIEHMLRYARGGLRGHLTILRQISGDDYDWQLNKPVPDRAG